MKKRLGTEAMPLRVAIVGAGPAGFFTAEQLFHQDAVIEVDMYERLPTPHGLIRTGVAPDHQKIKDAAKAFDKIAETDRFRFLGHVEVGTDISVGELKQFYHQIVLATGAQTDREIGIPGDDLMGSHSATEFVAWLNGHPDYRECKFDLEQERVVIIGVGNVAIDIARILCRTPAELARTDIPDDALQVLQNHGLREIYLLGRRGPMQAAFTTPQIKEVGNLAGADVVVKREEVELDEASRLALERSQNRNQRRKVEIIQGFAEREIEGKRRRLIIRFLVSPVEILGDRAGRVRGIRLVKNKLVPNKRGALWAKPTDEMEELDCGLVFRSVGYKGVPVPGVSFDDRRGIIPNERGRVVGYFSPRVILGEYVVGWIKRGPAGIIGTNKPDAVETVACMMADFEEGLVLNPIDPRREAVDKRLEGLTVFSYADWHRINEMELARGEARGCPRVKFTSIEEMLRVKNGG